MKAYDAAMRVARWRWVLVPMVVVVAGCLPQPAPAVPASVFEVFRSRKDGSTFSVQTPPAGLTGQDIVATLRKRAIRTSLPMVHLRGVPIYGTLECSQVPG